MAENSSEIVEPTAKRTPKKKGKGKKYRTVKITVEFDQEQLTEGVTSLLGKISDLVR